MINFEYWYLNQGGENFIQAYLNRVIEDGGENLLSRAEIEALLPPDWQNASFLNVPSSRKVGKLYSIIGSDLTTTRASIAREFTSSSLFSSAVVDLPRISFAGGYKGYRGESERTNIRIDSSDFTNKTFSGSSGVTPTILGTSIVEGGKALQVRETTATGSHLIRVNNIPTPDTPLVTGTTYTSTRIFSLTENRNTVRIIEDGQASVLLTCNVRTGAITSVGANVISSELRILSFGLISVEDIVYSLSMTFVANVTLGRPLTQIASASGDISYAGDPAEGLTMYHHQYEIGTYATSPIVTGASAIIRLKDLATVSGVGNEIGQVNSTVLVKFNASNFSTLRTALTLDGAGGSLKFQKLANNDIQVMLLNGATTVFSVVISGSLQGIQKLAIAYSNAGYISSLNGSTGASGTLGGAQPTLTDITIGSDITNSLHWDDTVGLVTLWKGAKNQTQLNELTQ